MSKVDTTALIVSGANREMLAAAADSSPGQALSSVTHDGVESCAELCRRHWLVPAELSGGDLGKRGHAFSSCHCGVAIRVSSFLQQVEGLDDVIALAAVGLALRALKASQETIDAKGQRVARSLGNRRLIVHVPTGDFRCRCRGGGQGQL